MVNLRLYSHAMVVFPHACILCPPNITSFLFDLWSGRRLIGSYVLFGIILHWQCNVAAIGCSPVFSFWVIPDCCNEHVTFIIIRSPRRVLKISAFFVVLIDRLAKWLRHPHSTPTAGHVCRLVPHLPHCSLSNAFMSIGGLAPQLSVRVFVWASADSLACHMYIAGWGLLGVEVYSVC